MIKKSKILVTGGLGFIGSHTVVELSSQGFEIVIVDDLSNSSIDTLKGLQNITKKNLIFEKIDLKNKTLVKSLFNKYNDIDGVIHFAASKAVGESVINPLKYYENNLITLINLLQEINIKERDISFIFSSSCTVYGQAKELPITEKDSCLANNNLKAISLRYFNPIGAHPSKEIGELPIGEPQNLIPFITQTAIGKHNQLTVFGNDYPTKDGTCIRDYIHVVDLAKAHIKSLKRLIENKNILNYDVFNIGTGKGSSVMEVIKSFEKVSGQKLKYIIGPKRKGDIIEAYADTKKANKILNWKTEQNLDQAMLSAWEWEKKLQQI